MRNELQEFSNPWEQERAGIGPRALQFISFEHLQRNRYEEDVVPNAPGLQEGTQELLREMTKKGGTPLGVEHLVLNQFA